MLKFLFNSDVPHIVVATKCDKMKEDELIKSLTVLNEHYDLPPGYPIPFSSITGMGRKDLWRVIKAAIMGELVEEVDDQEFEIGLSLENSIEKEKETES
jgi:GTP-binding protein EngB required for normal cell division